MDMSFGHGLAGILFYIFGIWRLLHDFYYHIKFEGTQQNHSKKSVMAYSFRFAWHEKYIPLEGIVKFIVSMTGFVSETFVGVNVTITERYHHCNMYAFFGLSGLVDILIFYGFPIPGKFDYFMHTTSFFIEGLQFSFHMHKKIKLHIVIHLLLIYTSFLNSIAVICLMIMKKCLIWNVFYGICLLVQGSWFIHVAIIVFTKPADFPSIEKKAVILFCWHVFLNTVSVTLLYGLMAKIVKPCDNVSLPRYGDVHHKSDLQEE